MLLSLSIAFPKLSFINLGFEEDIETRIHKSIKITENTQKNRCNNSHNLFFTKR